MSATTFFDIETGTTRSVTVIEATSWSDLDGSLIERANEVALRRDFPEVAVLSGPLGWHCLGLWDGQASEELAGALAGLDIYAVYDDMAYVELEREITEEAWQEWGHAQVGELMKGCSEAIIDYFEDHEEQVTGWAHLVWEHWPATVVTATDANLSLAVVARYVAARIAKELAS